LLSPGDIVIDGGNSPFGDAQKHFDLLHAKGIEFVDVGVSGGPMGALTGASLMVGGNEKLYEYLFPLYRDLAVPGGVAHFEGVGAGHYVKMAHNAIEYGMMQALAEGFTLLGKSPYVIDLAEAASVYSHGSVIESRLVTWLLHAFSEYGKELTSVKGSVDDLGEGRWALEFAEKLGIVDWTLKAAIDFRDRSKEHPDFTGQILSAIRGQFGGHDVK
jgi:6-phosphogluconate dehydrogenase